MLCKKAIGTLLYIYHWSKFVKDDGKAKDISFLDLHFKLIDDMVLGLNLDKFESAEHRAKMEGPDILKTSDDINKSMFASLEIKENEKVLYSK